LYAPDGLRRKSSFQRINATVTNATTAAGIGQFLYDTDSGRLSIDANGSTAGGVYTVLILQNLVSLTAADIFLA
jgi:hypothetical protein